MECITTCYQKLGCAMGTICAPNYANIFMGKFKRNFIYPCLQISSNFYCRFINDILLLWNGSETQLLDFTIRLNSRHDTIKFDFRYSKSGIEFLDIKIYKNKEKEQIANGNVRETNRSEKFFEFYFSIPEIIN